jgi:uncharacterized membrane protein YraQ (UPF0718 family)
MNVALLITLASVLAGGVVAALTSRGHTLLETLRTFAITAVATLAAVQLLPESVDQLGAWALLLFVAALALPGVFTYVARRLFARPVELSARGVGVELGYFGFVAHQFVEGLALAAYANPEHYDHDHVGLVLAVAAHTVPMTALFIGTVLVQRGRRPAIRRVVALLAASVMGFATAEWVAGAVTAALAPTLAAVVAGFLCHVLLHGVGKLERRGVAVRVLDVVAVAAGIALPLASVHSHSESGEHLQHALGHAWVDLALETAPMLLLGLVLGALLQVVGSRMQMPWLGRGSASRQALRGIAIGAPLPLCACGVLPIAESLRARGAGAALVVAFLVSTPELGPETLTLTVRFIGWPYALLRVGAALVLAYVAGVAFAWLVARAKGSAPSPTEPVRASVAPTSGGLASALHYFDELLLHTAPWTVVGLLAAAFIEVSFEPGALAPLASSGLDILVIALVALPTYVCAASATPMAALLLLKGVSPGAVLVGLLLGPTTNVATIAVLGRAYGPRVAWGGVAVIAIAACLMGLAVNAIDIPLSLPDDLGTPHTHGVLAWASAAILGAVLLRQLWRSGLGPWLEILDAATHPHPHGAAHDHEPNHDHGHDHGHDHAHHHHH